MFVCVCVCVCVFVYKSYIYIYMICKHNSWITFLNQPELFLAYS